jgi:hypothetical protein
MDNGFFEKVTPEVNLFAPQICSMAFYPYMDGRRLRTWVQRLLRAVGQRLLPQLPSQSAIAGEPGPQEDSRQHSAEVVRMSYSSPIGLGGMYSAVSRRDVSIW